MAATLFQIRRGLVLVGLIIAVGCASSGYQKASRVKDVEPDAMGNVRTTGIETQDILSVADDLARDLMGTPRIARSSPEAPCRIVLRPIQDYTNERWDADALGSQMRSELLRFCQGKIDFLYRTLEEKQAGIDPAIQTEKKMKSAGVVDTGPDAVQKGADFFLVGEVREHVVSSGSGRDQATFFFFHLVDVGTSSIVWDKSYGPIRKETLKSSLYQRESR